MAFLRLEAIQGMFILEEHSAHFLRACGVGGSRETQSWNKQRRLWATDVSLIGEVESQLATGGDSRSVKLCGNENPTAKGLGDQGFDSVSDFL